jgi:tetratricopeptide (TPR) repeat protein
MRTNSFSRKSTWLSGALLTLAVLLVFWPALRGEFVYDDELLFGRSNVATSSLRAAIAHTFDPLWSFDRPTPTSGVGGSLERAFWRPLAVVAFALGRALPFDGATGPHVVSLLAHLAAVFAAWRLATRLIGHELAGSLVALLFALHPLMAEPVGWVAAVNDPLTGAFVLWALVAHARWCTRGPAGVARPLVDRVPFVGGLLAFCALLTKEQALVLPVLVVGLDLALGRRPSARSLAPYVVALGAWYLARAFIFRDVFAGLLERQGDFGFPSLARAVSFRVELVGGALALLAWPAELAVFRPVRPELPLGDNSVVVGALWLAAYGVALGVALWRRARAAAFGLALMLVAPVLVAAALHTAGRYPLSDRYLYLSVFGAALALVAALWRSLPQKVAVVTALALCAAAVVPTRAHLGTFASSEAFHARAVEAAPDDPYVQLNAGRAELIAYERTLDLRRLYEAYCHFLSSLTAGTYHGQHQVDDDPRLSIEQRIERLERMLHAPADERRPDPTVFWTAHDRLEANLGQLAVHVHAASSAPIDDFHVPLEIAEQLVGYFGDEPRVWTAKGQVHQLRGELDLAAQSFQSALERDRGNVLAWRKLAAVKSELGQHGDARRAYDEAARYAPWDLDLLTGALMEALREGQLPVARTYLDRYIQAAPATREAAYWRGQVALAEGRFDDALAAFDRALALDPGWGDAMKHRALALLRKEDVLGALEAFGDAARALPEDFDVHYNIAALMGLVEAPDGPEITAQRAQRVAMLIRAYELSPPDEKRLLLQRELEPFVAGNPGRAFTLATISEKRKDLFSARFWLERTIALADGWPAQERAQNEAAAATRLGSVMRQQGDREEAVEMLTRALALDPESFEASFERATALAELKRAPEAGAEARRALARMDGADVVPEMRTALRDLLESWIALGDAAETVGPPPPPR